MHTPATRARHRTLSFLALVLALLLGGPAAQAGEVEDLLNQAKDLERIQEAPEEALAIYERLAEREEVPDAVRSESLWRAASIHERAKRFDRAADYWKALIADAALDAKHRALATRKLAELTKRTAADAPPSEDAARRLRAEKRAEDRRRSQAQVDDARAALAARRFEDATHLCLIALMLDPENTAAKALLDEIEAQRPDLGSVLGRLIQFVQTKELEEFEWLRGEVRNLERAARHAFDLEDWRTADRYYRRAIARIDDSGFLTLGATVDTGSLGEVRARLLTFLRQTHDRGGQAGLSFEPEPEAPDFEARRGSGARALFGTLADMFTPREAGGESLHFFEFAPRLKRGPGRRLVTSSFPAAGVKVEHRAGTLGRARWAERWIRGHIGARWMGPDELARRGAGEPGRGRRRILMRAGDLICAQHGEEAHERIEALRRAFGVEPPPLRVDVHVFAVDAAGAVRAAEALRVRAGPRDAGTDHVVQGRLLRDCLGALEGLQGVAALGNAQVRLDGDVNVLLELTRFTEEHPAYRDVGAPALTVEDADARYGLWLDLYAEDLPGRVRPGNDRCALSLVARATFPHPLHASHVVPRTSRANPRWTRRPILVEHTLEANRELPHYGTFVMQGIPNPFPGSNQEHGELLVLVGVTRQDTPTPDPPRASDRPTIVPADLVSRDYRLGPLSTEVRDQIVPEDWPALRTVAEGLTPADRQRQRDANLANILLQLAHIDPQGPGGAGAVVVQDHLVHGTMSGEDHIRLQQAVRRLRARENDLYEVSVRSAQIPAADWKAWTAIEGMQRTTKGNYLAKGAARERLEALLLPLVARGGLFDAQRAMPARATQQVMHTQLRQRQITKDLHRRNLQDGQAGYTPVPGVAEEGLVVEIRPKVEVEEGGTGLRMVVVRARAARLKTIEQRAYPGARRAGAIYDVPIWHAGTQRFYSEASDVEILDDDALIALPLIVPGSEEERIVVVIGVRRTQ